MASASTLTKLYYEHLQTLLNFFTNQLILKHENVHNYEILSEFGGIPAHILSTERLQQYLFKSL